ncbi:hypothetical protein FACS1894219_03570 [Clostridia bacterium]|nr:hypothetical protein FACS1894219_03570 [Clostridia bacterium]
MTKEELYADLDKLLNFDAEIAQKSDEIEYFRMFVSANGGDSVSVTDPLIADCIRKVCEIEKAIRADVSEMLDLKTRYLNLFREIQDHDCRALLEYRYIIGLTWEEVAAKMGRSYVHVQHRVQKKAMLHLESICYRHEINKRWSEMNEKK